MSTQQRNDACMISVDRVTGDALRDATLVVLEANHHYFEDVRDLGLPGRLALAAIYRDAFAVLDALGWEPSGDGGPFDVPVTSGHADQLRRRRADLAHANVDRLDVGADASALAATRTAALVLDRVLAAYATCLGA